MRRIIYCISILGLFALPVEAQKYFKYSGIVQDSSNGDFVPFALLYDSASIGRHTESDQYGRFSFLLKEGNYTFIITNVGYQTKKIFLKINNDQQVIIKLNTITLPELLVQGTASLNQENNFIDISPEKLRSIPTILGEKDILKALTILPGVAQGQDGTNQFSIRGGSYDQNLVLLDGSILYNTSHFFGFLSAIDPYAIKSMRVYKDGFPVDYGGRLSSVVDIRLKEGNLKKTESYLNVGLVTSSFGINGPIKSEKLSFLVSSRIAYPGLITLPFKSSYERDSRNAFVSYFMYDLVSKLTWKINDRQSLYLSGTIGNDFFLSGNRENNFRTDWNINWGNSILALRYNGTITKSLDLSINANYNNYRYQSKLVGTQLDLNYKTNIVNQSSIQDLKMDLNTKWNIGTNVNLLSGFSFTSGQVLPEIKFSDLIADTSSSLNSFASKELSIYQSIKVGFSKAISLDLGYRYSTYLFNKESFCFFQPRVLLGYQILKSNANIYLAYSKMFQPVHLLLNPSNGYVNEVWLSANKSLPPQQMNEVTFGVHTKSNFGDIRFAIFLRNFKDLIEIKDNIKFLKFVSNDWNNLFESNGTGISRGIEVSFLKSLKKMNIMASYTFTDSKRTFANINKGKTFPSPVERPHVISINSDYLKNERSTFTLGFTYLSGTPVTLPEYFSNNEFIYTDRYNTRLPSYKRVDFSYKKSYKNRKGLPKEWTFSVYNLFFNRNITQILPATYGIPLQGMPSVNIGWRPYFQGKSFFNFIPGVNFYYKFR